MSTKYIEEIQPGQAFSILGAESDRKISDRDLYILSCDFKSNGQRMCINLVNGTSRWLESTCVVDQVELYTMDKENCIIAVRETKNE
jgi:hypothetical protein